MELLSQGIQSTSCPLRRLSLSSVEWDSANLENQNGRNDPFALALARNTTLEDVSLSRSFVSTEDLTLFDLTLFDLFYEMSSNGQPQGPMRTLRLENCDLGKSTQTQDQTVLLVDSLISMLSLQHCSIVELYLEDCGLGFHSISLGGRDILRSLMSGLQENSSIQVLGLNQNLFDVSDLQYIMDGITGCRNLRQVELEADNVEVFLQNYDNASWLTNSRLVQPHPPTQLRKLVIDAHIWNARRWFMDHAEGSDAELQAVLVDLLDHNPLIYDLGEEFKRGAMPRVTELLNLNQCVGPLRTAPPPRREQGHQRTEENRRPLSRIPLSFWPIVLERTNNKLVADPAGCANVVHHILKQGPGLLEG